MLEQSIQQLKAIIEACVLKAIEKKIDSINEFMDKLEGRCFDLEKRLDDSENENLELQQKIVKMEERQDEIKTTVNDMEQYSRRNNLRLFGVKESEGENVSLRIITKEN